jgi:hypothetical protein
VPMAASRPKSSGLLAANVADTGTQAGPAVRGAAVASPAAWGIAQILLAGRRSAQGTIMMTAWLRRTARPRPESSCSAAADVPARARYQVGPGSITIPGLPAAGLSAGRTGGTGPTGWTGRTGRTGPTGW